MRFFLLFILIFLYSSLSNASFIEATMGTAVVNDATATYYNPAALTLLKNTQIIGLGSYANFQTNFNGESTQTTTHFTQTGSTSNHTHYYLPSVYFAYPSSDHLTVGFAVLTNFFNNNLDENSILRYAQSNNSVKNIDINPALGFKLNSYISLGISVNFSYAEFLLQPTYGFPSLNIPDSQSRNDASGNAIGADVGILIRPTKSTLIGLNYRSVLDYTLKGTSVFEGQQTVTSNQYAFSFWSPARTVLTISQFIHPKVNIFSTLQYIEWSVFDAMNIEGIATVIAGQPAIIDANVPFHLHNAWMVTVGGQYFVSPKWIVRIASTYNESPGNPDYQLANGDSIILGGSMGYELLPGIILDGSYAHAFIEDQDIHIISRNNITGVNSGSRDAVSLKLTWNI